MLTHNLCNIFSERFIADLTHLRNVYLHSETVTETQLAVAVNNTKSPVKE